MHFDGEAFNSRLPVAFHGIEVVKRALRVYIAVRLVSLLQATLPQVRYLLARKEEERHEVTPFFTDDHDVGALLKRKLHRVI